MVGYHRQHAPKSDESASGTVVRLSGSKENHTSALRGVCFIGIISPTGKGEKVQAGEV